VRERNFFLIFDGSKIYFLKKMRGQQILFWSKFPFFTLCDSL